MVWRHFCFAKSCYYREETGAGLPSIERCMDMAAVALDAPLAVVRPARKWRRIAVMLAVAAIWSGSVVLYKQVRAPTDPFSAGLSAHAAEHLTEAAKDYQQVLASSNNNKFAHYNLGLIDQVSGRLASAAS